MKAFKLNYYENEMGIELEYDGKTSYIEIEQAIDLLTEVKNGRADLAEGLAAMWIAEAMCDEEELLAFKDC